MTIMTIEIRQMLIRSTVLPEGGAKASESDGAQDFDEIISQIREECRQMVIDLLRRERER